MEIWKDIYGYENFYQVSNYGRVKSLKRVDSRKHMYEEKILSNKTEKNGYQRLHLSKDGIGTYLSVHRAVAEAFVHKQDGCNIVNHLDNNRANNNAENLEWTTHKGNMQHATKQGRMRYNPENLKKAINSRKRAVVGTMEDKTIRFESASEAERHGFNRRHIANCCNKKYGYNTHKKYSWRYEDE